MSLPIADEFDPPFEVSEPDFYRLRRAQEGLLP